MGISCSLAALNDGLSFLVLTLLLILVHSSTFHLSWFVNCIWTRWLPSPSSWNTGHPPPREAACLGSAPLLASALMWAYGKDQVCPGNPLGGWHSGSLAVCWGTACSVRNVIFSNLNFWNVIFFMSETCPGSLLCLTQKPSLPNFNFLFQNSKSP